MKQDYFLPQVPEGYHPEALRVHVYKSKNQEQKKKETNDILRNFT